MVELAQIAGIGGGGHPSFISPVSGVRKVASADPEPGLHRRNRTHIREEARTVELRRLVQELDGLLGVAVGLGEESHRHEPAEAPLAHRRTVSESRGGLEVSVGALEVSDLDVDLADPHVQVGGCARHAIAVCLGQLQRSPVEPACLTGSTGREPQSASSVVVPNPAGADTNVSLDSAPRRRRSPSLGRVTRARRSFGTYSLVAIMQSTDAPWDPIPRCTTRVRSFCRSQRESAGWSVFATLGVTAADGISRCRLLPTPRPRS